MINAHRLYFKYRAKGGAKGQAILELAIFGAILIGFLGVLLKYGLKYGYQQQLLQYTFRKALDSSKTYLPTPTTHYIVRDRHIPNPSDIFSMGEVEPFESKAAVTRSNRLDESADYSKEMPRIKIDVAGNKDSSSVNEFTMAAFNYNRNNKKSKRRYEIVYGAGNFWRIDKDTKNALDWDSGEKRVDVANVNEDDPPYQRFLTWLNEHFPGAHGTPGEDGKDPDDIDIRIVDHCNGQIVEYDTAVSQCRLIMDDQVCVDSCKLSGDLDCEEACKWPIEPPWYCQGGKETDTLNHVWSFPNLKRLFFPSRSDPRDLNKAPTWGMGLQADSVQTVTMNNRLDKNETSIDGITTQDTFNSDNTADRKIFYIDNGERAVKDVQTKVSPEPEKKTRTWYTPW